jgi:DNA polymerase-4
LHPFETHTRSRTLPVPTASDTELFRAAWSLYQAEPWAGRPVRLIGLGLSGWAEEVSEQPDLFAGEPLAPEPRIERLDATLDAIREKFGEGALHRGLSRRR